MYDVVIAGAGPTGLFLACELQLAGVAVLVLEQMQETRTPLKEGFMGGRGLNLPSVEAFYRRGLLPAVRETALGWMEVGEKPGISMTPKDSANPPLAPRFAGHFAGIMLDGNKIDFSKDKYLAGGPSASGGIVSLAGLEDVLRERAEKLGVAIRLSTPAGLPKVCWIRTRQNGIPWEPGRLSGRVRRCRFCGPSHMGARWRRLCAT